MIIPINNGYFNTKSVNDIIFRSCCTELSFDNMLITGDKINLDNKMMVIGTGKPEITLDKTVNPNTKFFVLNVLSRLTDADSIGDFDVLLSAPPMSYRNQRRLLPEYLTGSYIFYWNDEFRHININSVTVAPETFVTFLSNNDDGIYDDELLIIIDVGGFTTNICKLDKGSFNDEDYYSYAHGMFHLDTQVSRYFNNKFTHLDFNCKWEDIERYRRKGLFINSDEDMFAKEFNNINKIYDRFVTDIINICRQMEWGIKDCKVLITGGGGQILYDNFKKILFHAKLGNNPLFDNLNGLDVMARSFQYA